VSKGGLGKGLTALISTASQGSHGDQEVHELPVELIRPNPNQPRIEIDEERVCELAKSIQQVGVLQPIIVRPLGDKYQIIAGERRWRASRQAGLSAVPVRVIASSDVDALELALVENLQREDLNPIEEAKGYRQLLSLHQMTQAELADKVCKSRSAITNALRLLDLPEAAQDFVFSGQLSSGHARAVLSLPGDEDRVKLSEKIVREGLSVREAESLARLLAAGQALRETRQPTPKAFKVVARALRRKLGTNVRVKQVKDKGKIEIEFRGEDELARVYRILMEAEGTGQGGLE